MVGRDPRFGQPADHQQLAQVPGIGAVGLGALLVAAPGGGLRRLGEMDVRPDRMQLLGDEPPAPAVRGRGHRALAGTSPGAADPARAGIALVCRAKEPGPGMALDAVPMDFSHGGSFRTRPSEAYERLLHDAMAGDQTLFLREDAVERSWEIVAPVLEASAPAHRYAAGTWGPRVADELIAPRAWRPR